MEVNGKIAVITGANKGIGLACAEKLINLGAKVYGICRSDFSSDNPNFEILRADVGDQAQVDRAFDHILSRHNAVDILINNAGLGYFSPCEDLNPDAWREMFNTNVNGIFYCCRRSIPGMKSSASGHIINIASTAGLEGYVQTSGYCATKFAVRGFSDSLYKELRDYGIKVTCVYPGSVKTDFFRHHPSIDAHDFMLDPDDLASQILYAIQSPPNFHHVNLEIRPLQPRGPIKR